MIDVIKKKFSLTMPLFVSSDRDFLKLEMKPYLQPFEENLAIRELLALIGTETPLREENGYYIIKTEVSEEFLLSRLTYWQRLGRDYLIPTLQKSLEFTQNGFEKTKLQKELHNARRLRYGPHDIHEYRGKFFPQLVKSLINIAGVSENSFILDPMSGSGTTPCEVLAMGCNALGLDLNPLSVLISQVKCSLILETHKTFKENIDKNVNKFRFSKCKLEDHWNSEDLKYLKLWFSEAALDDCASILGNINKINNPVYKEFFRVCFSNIIRPISWQKETDLRVRKEIKVYDKGMAIDKFNEEVLKQYDKIYSYLSVLPPRSNHPMFSIKQGDSLRISELFSQYKNKVDLLITSPPYATALPYLDTDRLSLIILGLLPHKEHKYAEFQMVGTREISERQRVEAWDYYLIRRKVLPSNIIKLIDEIANHNHGDNIGFRRRNLPALLGRYFINMFDAMKSAHSLMKKGASAFYIVGNNSTTVNSKKIMIPTDSYLYEIGEVAGWKQNEFIPMELLSSRDIFRENRGSTETILHFRA